MKRYKIVNKNTGEVVAHGENKTPLEVVKEYKLAYAAQQHLKAVFYEL